MQQFIHVPSSRIPEEIDPENQQSIEEHDLVRVDACKFWAAIKKMDSFNQSNEMASWRFWMVMNPSWFPDENTTNNFEKHFRTNKAYKFRMVACVGTKPQNYEKELMLYKTASFAASYLENEEKEGIRNLAGKKYSKAAVLQTLGIAFVEMIRDKETVSLRRLCDVIEWEGEVPEARGGEESTMGEMWTQFCLFARNHDRPPTEKELEQELLGTLPEEDKLSARKTFSKNLGKLGLRGLPKGD